MPYKIRNFIFFFLSLFILGACQVEKPVSDNLVNEDNEVIAVDAIVTRTADSMVLVKMANIFTEGSLLKSPSVVNCTLSGGVQAQCVSLTFGTEPKDYKTGPWCPRNIQDSSDKGGIWLDGGKIHDVSGAFIQNLDAFYKDNTWQMYNTETGDINVTDTKEECAAAARPDVDPKYYNHCVECKPSYMDAGSTVTYVLPINPIVALRQEKPRFSGVGVSLSGVKFDASAPVDAILGAHTLAPFDDCGGHVNLHAGYHIHAEKGCGKQADVVGGHAAMIGYAMDGYPLHAQKNKEGVEATDLDSCRGHTIEGHGYHYHAADPAKNEILPCFSGQYGCSSNDPKARCDSSANRRPSRP